MPLVSDVDSSSTETEQKLPFNLGNMFYYVFNVYYYYEIYLGFIVNNLYNDDSCKILIKEDDKESYDYYNGIII